MNRYTDSNWCRDIDDMKSTTGYIFLLGGAPVPWCSRKEPMVSLSSCEAEYIAVSICACQAVWLMNLIDEIGVEKCGGVNLRIDNISTINLAKNPIPYGRSKHIEMRFHYLGEQVSKGKLKLELCRSENQVADVLTKGDKIEMLIKLIIERYNVLI